MVRDGRRLRPPYGNNNICQMWQAGRAPILYASTPWQEALDHPGATQMGYLRKFMEAHASHTLVPDQRVIANGPLEGGAKIRAPRSAMGRSPSSISTRCGLHAG